MSAPERDELPDVYCPACDNEQAKNNLVDESFGHEFGTEERWDTEEYCDECGEPTWSDRSEYEADLRERIVELREVLERIVPAAEYLAGGREEVLAKVRDAKKAVAKAKGITNE